MAGFNVGTAVATAATGLVGSRPPMQPLSRQDSGENNTPAAPFSTGLLQPVQVRDPRCYVESCWYSMVPLEPLAPLLSFAEPVW
jgi:hypothetical protein